MLLEFLECGEIAGFEPGTADLQKAKQNIIDNYRTVEIRKEQIRNTDRIA
jgi:hypothetical protein